MSRAAREMQAERRKRRSASVRARRRRGNALARRVGTGRGVARRRARWRARCCVCPMQRARRDTSSRRMPRPRRRSCRRCRSMAGAGSRCRAACPLIEAVNVEQFVPQMVNLELVGGVNFQKGCYPGRRSSRAATTRHAEAAHGLFDSAAEAHAGDDVFHDDDPSQPAGRIVGNAAPGPHGGSSSADREVKLAALERGQPASAQHRRRDARTARAALRAGALDGLSACASCSSTTASTRAMPRRPWGS